MPLPATARPAAASSRSVRLLDGPSRPATVLGAFPAALYVDVDGGLLPVVTPDGLRLPTALVLGRRLPGPGWGVRPGEVVEVGAGRVRLPGQDVVVVRTWAPRPARPGGDGGDPGVPLGRWGGSPGWRAAAVDVARRALACRDLAGRDVACGDLADCDLADAGLPGAVAALVGAGRGLTPSGDDVLCGVLLGLRVTGRLDAVARLWDAVRPRLGATATLSAALLTEAADGYAVPQLVRLADAVARGDRPQAAAAAVGVARIGHSSGRDLLAGLAGALEAVSPVTAEAS